MRRAPLHSGLQVIAFQQRGQNAGCKRISASCPVSDGHIVADWGREEGIACRFVEHGTP